MSGKWGADAMAGLSGERLAAFPSVCRRLRDISLRDGPHLTGQLLTMQLPQICSLAGLQVYRCPFVCTSDVGELQAAFDAEHGCHLPVLHNGR
jgi:hypothetical protein